MRHEQSPEARADPGKYASRLYRRTTERRGSGDQPVTQSRVITSQNASPA